MSSGSTSVLTLVCAQTCGPSLPLAHLRPGWSDWTPVQRGAAWHRQGSHQNVFLDSLAQGMELNDPDLHPHEAEFSPKVPTLVWGSFLPSPISLSFSLRCDSKAGIFSQIPPVEDTEGVSAILVKDVEEFSPRVTRPGWSFGVLEPAYYSDASSADQRTLLCIPSNFSSLVIVYLAG